MRKSFEYDYELLHSKYTLMYNYIFTKIFSNFTKQHQYSIQNEHISNKYIW